MACIKDEFFSEAPTKILVKAEQFSKTLDSQLLLPGSISKSMVVKTKAQQHTEHIDFAIKMSGYQQHLFRSKEDRDLQTRENFRKKLEAGDKKIANNLKELEKKKHKKDEDYEKHIKEIYKRYEQDQSMKRMREKQQALKLRKQLQEFYQKQAERKSQKDHAQVRVSTCYEGAVNKINDLHKKNEEYARKAELALDKQLTRNDHFSERLGRKIRIVSEVNQRKPEVYSHSIEILEHKRRRFIQTCGRNEDGYLNAWEKSGKTIADWRKKRGEETKKQMEKWKENKYRVEAAKAEVPDKCLNILDKTSKASFRRTASTFRDSANRFEETVLKNKKQIKEQDELKKDQIMQSHIDTTLRNCSTAKVNERMHSMRHNARKLANDFL